MKKLKTTDQQRESTVNKFGTDKATSFAGILWPAIVVLLTLIVVSPSMNNGFVNWDDVGYVTQSPYLRTFGAEAIRVAFSNNVMGNYHPLTILSYDIEYTLAGFDPLLYHADNILLHLAGVLLTYILMMMLTGKRMIAAFTALLFGIHPMHMESVAWVSGRKDVLYSVFYLGAAICYLKAVTKAKNQMWLWMAFSVLLFGCSVLSKPIAVTLVPALFLLDYWQGRKISASTVLAKLPYLAIAILAGIAALRSQSEIGVVNNLGEGYNLLDRIALGCYALITYCWKVVLPFGLSCFYPYPIKQGGMLPAMYYVDIALVAAGLAAFIKYGIRQKAILFGGLFFLVHIVLLLQFIPVGGAVVADRYSYMAYTGIFFTCGYYLDKFTTANLNANVRYLIPVVCFVFAMLSYQRVQVWASSNSLWTDQIQKQPDDVSGYNNLAEDYMERLKTTGDMLLAKTYMDSARMMYEQALVHNDKYINSLIGLGTWHRRNRNNETAKQLFRQALSLKQSDHTPIAANGLAVTYFVEQKFDSASYWFSQAIKQRYYYPQAHINYGNALDAQNKTDAALAEYAIAIAQAPDGLEGYDNRGRVLLRLGRAQAARSDFNNYLRLKPDDGEFLYLRAQTWAMQNDREQARADLQAAIAAGYNQIAQDFYQQVMGKTN